MSVPLYDEWKEKVFAARNENGGVSLIYPALHYQGTKEDWIRRHDLDIADEYVELWPIQVPVDRTHREAWVIKDGSIVVDEDRVRELYGD